MLAGLGAEYRIELKDGPLSNHEPDEGKAVIVYRGPGAIYVKVDKRAAKTDDETYAWRTDRPVIVITPTLENGHHREVPASVRLILWACSTVLSILIPPSPLTDGCGIPRGRDT